MWCFYSKLWEIQTGVSSKKFAGDSEGNLKSSSGYWSKEASLIWVLIWVLLQVELAN